MTQTMTARAMVVTKLDDPDFSLTVGTYPLKWYAGTQLAIECDQGDAAVVSEQLQLLSENLIRLHEGRPVRLASGGKKNGMLSVSVGLLRPTIVRAGPSGEYCSPGLDLGVLCKEADAPTIAERFAELARILGRLARGESPV